MTLSTGCDHAGFEMKEKLKQHLSEKGITLIDRGSFSIESTDYPDYSNLVSGDVLGWSFFEVTS